MPSNKANLDITANLKDNASAPAKQLGANLEKTSRGMAEGFGKAASTMNFASSQLGTMSGAAAEAGAKLGEVGSLVFSGSPLLIGIGALTAGVLAGQKAWELYKAEAETTKAIMGGLTEVIQRGGEAAKKAADENKDLEQAIRNLGKTSEEIAIQEVDTKAKILEIRRKNQLALVGELQTKKGLTDLEAAALAQAKAELGTLTALSREAERNASLLKLKIGLERMNAIEVKQSAEAEKERAKAAGDSAKAQSDWLAFIDKDREADLAKDMERQRKRAELIASLDNRIQQGLNENAERNAERRNAIIEKEAAMRQQMAQAAADVAIQATQAALNAEKNAGAAALNVFVGYAKKQIVAAAATAAGKAAAGSAIGGPIAAGLAASATFALVTALASKLPKAATGGVVTGGQPGRDSVPVLLQPGEIIVPTQRANPQRSRGSGASQPMQSGPVSVSVNLNALDVSSVSRSSVEKLAREVAEGIATLEQRGMA